MSEVEWHREMLADRRRVRDFGEAVRAVVQPGDVVLDLGTGTGLLALFACRGGARKVYAVEQGYIIDVARQIARQNGLGDRIVFIQGHSTEVDLPESVDLIVTETVGSFGLEEQILKNLSDARRRFLKPGGRLLPDRLDLFLAPTEEGGHYRRWGGEIREDWDLDFAPLADLGKHVSQGLWADPGKFLGSPQKLLSCDFYQDQSEKVQGEVQVEVVRQGEIAGWVGWFAVRCERRLVTSTEPPVPGSSWENVFFPIGEPVAARPGDLVCLRMRLDDPFWTWRFTMSHPPVDRTMGDFFSYPPAAFKPAGGGMADSED